MMFDLTGMTALVTGAIGRARQSSIAKALAAQGARLAVSGSNVDEARGVPRRAWRRSCRAAVQPVATARRSTQLVPQAVEALGGKLDILVNNAGVTRDNLADADEGRGVRRGHPGQPRSRVPADARGGASR